MKECDKGGCVHHFATENSGVSRISERGCSARICKFFAHAQIVGRCGFEREFEYVRIVNLRSAHSVRSSSTSNA